MEQRLFKEYIALGAMLIGLLHTLRNLTEIYYLAYLVAVVSIVLLNFNRRSGLYVIAFIVLLIYVSVLSYSSDRTIDLSIGMARFSFVAPFAIYFFSADFEQKHQRRIAAAFLVFICASAISLLYQLFFGEIAWFAETSWRSGVVKYSSLAGNENAYGAIAGVGLLLVFNILRSMYLRSLASILIIVAGFASLQKMAIVTMVLAVCTQLIIYAGEGSSQRKIVLLYLGMGSMVVGLISLSLKDFENPYFNYAVQIFSSDAIDVGDVSIFQSAIDRVSILPLIVVKYWGGLEVLLGVGLYGGGGVLGYQDLPMAHNFVVEMIAIFGIFLGGVIVLFFFELIIRSLRIVLRRDVQKCNLRRMYAAIYILLILGGFFTGGFLFHPVTGIIFWFVVAQLVKQGLRFNK